MDGGRVLGAGSGPGGRRRNGGFSLKILTLCRPCAEKLGQAYELTKIITGSEKDTCAECQRRRYTNKYRVGGVKAAGKE